MRSGGPDAPAGITIDPNLQMPDGTRHVIYFFNLDASGRWHVETHDILSRLLSTVDSGPEPSAVDTDHLLGLKYNAPAGTLAFAVDGTTITTVRPPAPFDTYQIGVGLACSYDEFHVDNCQASLRDYRYVVTHTG
jgi:hypothetical protein